MDVLVPIFAYFGSVVAIVLALAMSYDAFIYAPLHPTAARHVVMVAKAAVPGPATADATVARVRSPSATISSHHGAFARTDLASDTAPATRRASLLRGTVARQQHLRRPPSQLRAKEWAYQQGPLGFANGSAGAFGYDQYQ
jgi:hypothetical protein